MKPMKGFSVISILVSFFLWTACSSSQKVMVPEIGDGGNGYSKPLGENYYGSKFDPKGAVSLDDFLKTFTQGTQENVKISGTVDGVCAVKGCWMTLENQEGGSIRVSFIDYSFFMPFGIEGQKATVIGKASKVITPVNELRHYAEDAGKTEKEIMAITEPLEEVTIEAIGVHLE